MDLIRLKVSTLRSPTFERKTKHKKKLELIIVGSYFKHNVDLLAASIKQNYIEEKN